MSKLSATVLAFAGIVAGTTKAKQPPFSISLAATGTSINAGSDIWVSVQLTNKTSHNLSVPITEVNGVDMAYQYDVRRDSGVLVERLANDHPEVQIGSFKSRILKPGESTAREEVRLSKLNNMSRPGINVIRISRRVSTNPKEGVVKSNDITVTVTE